jgi:hypothetical protein
MDAASASTSPGQISRPAPRIIVVAPSRLRVPWFVVAFVTVPAIVVLSLIYVVALRSPPARQALLFGALPRIATMLAVSGAVGIVLTGVMVLWANRKPLTTEWPASVAPPGEPVARALSGIWRSLSRPPAISRVRAVLAEHGVDDAERAIVIGLGVSAIPEPSDVSFEPEVITPDQRFGKAHSTLIWAAVLLAFSLVGPRVIPGFSSGIRGGYLFFAAAFIIAVRWVWANVVRIGYLRIAPGMIQVLHYRLFSRRPAVRSYPIEAGTVVVLLQFRSFLRLQVARGVHVDEIGLSGVADHKAVAELIWRTLRSTATTPELSETELVG